jgi:hypothetical protein
LPRQANAIGPLASPSFFPKNLRPVLVKTDETMITSSCGAYNMGFGER